MSYLSHKWSALGKQQLGRYAEYLVKMELTLHGIDVYSAEVDDKGIDFVIRKDAQHYFDVQVKSSRNLTYIFFPEDRFRPCENLFAAVVLFFDDAAPEMYLVPSTVWLKPNDCFVHRSYDGLKSKPEYGINLSKRNLVFLESYAFDKTVRQFKPELFC